jgi:hypothetical protein
LEIKDSRGIRFKIKNKKIPTKVGDYFIRTMSILTTGLPHAWTFSRSSPPRIHG